MLELELSGVYENLENLDGGTLGLFDLKLETQVRFLEYLKRLKDCEKGKARGKGFGNC